MPCSTGLAMLASAKQAIALFFHMNKLTTHFPFAAATYVQSWKPGVSGHLNGQHWVQYSRWRHEATFLGQQTLHHALYVFMRMRKRLSTLSFDFSRNLKVVLR